MEKKQTSPPCAIKTTKKQTYPNANPSNLYPTKSLKLDYCIQCLDTDYLKSPPVEGQGSNSAGFRDLKCQYLLVVADFPDTATRDLLHTICAIKINYLQSQARNAFIRFVTLVISSSLLPLRSDITFFSSACASLSLLSESPSSSVIDRSSLPQRHL